MQNDGDLQSKSIAELETLFYEGLSAAAIPIDRELEILGHVQAEGKEGLVGEWAGLLIDVLKERSDAAGLLRVLQTLAAWRPGDEAFRALCRDALSAVLKHRGGVAMVEASGIAGGLAVDESLRRLGVLMALKPGVLCLDKTWGFGAVKSVDDFYRKIVIDFSRKPAHTMTFAYAGEALEIPAGDHLLVVRHRDPARFKMLLEAQADEVVRMALRSYGPMSVQKLKDLLTEGMLTEEQWKPFWDTARRGLKDDPLVEIPARRSDPIRLRSKAKAYDGEWFEALGKERDPERLLELALELDGAVRDGKPLVEGGRAALAERFAFAVRAVEDARPDLLVRLILAARNLGFGPPEAGADAGPNPEAAFASVKKLFVSKRFEAAVSRLPSREVLRLIRMMAEEDREGLERLLLSLLTVLPTGAITEAMDHLLASGKEGECADIVRTALRSRQAGPVLLSWIGRHLDRFDAWCPGETGELLFLLVESFREPRKGDSLKAQHQIQELLDDVEWLKGILLRVGEIERKQFLTKIAGARFLEETARRSLLARIIKAFPELTHAAEAAGGQGAEKPAAHFTSWRSYREREEQFRVLVEKTIPENSRDIAVARSYGDLSENHEYKTAKEMQGILLKRKGEIEHDLKTVKGTDFRGMDTDRAGMGTCVTVARPDGRRERYCILGEWDSDESRGIISCMSRLARILDGRRAGDEVVLPTGKGSGAGHEEACRIEAVGELPEDIKAWAAGTPG